MATLSNTKIKDTYQSLVKFNDNGNITTSPKRLTDGFGNASPFYVSTTQIGIGTSPNSSYDLHVYGNTKIGANLDVSGNLTVNGTLTYLNVTDLAVEDPLIKLAKDNDANILDIGLFGKYAVSTNVKYKGFFNDASDDKFKIFTGLTTEPTTVVNTSGTGYTTGTLVANLEGNVTGNLSGNVSGGTISGTTGTFSGLLKSDTLELTSGSDHLTFTESSGDWTINNSQQNNGITIYDGTGGIDMIYNGTSYFEVDSTGVHTTANIDFYVDTNLIYVDATNNLVGIGKTPSTYKLDVKGKIASDNYIIAGLGSGGVALTHNDGYGNANVTFNHVSGTPEQDGSSGRIVVTTDGTTAKMTFELKDDVTSGVAVDTPIIMELYSSSVVSNVDTKVRTTGGGILSLQRNDASIINGNPLGRLRFSGDDPTDGTFNSGAEIRGEAAGTWDTDNYPTELQFYTTATNTDLLALTIDSSQNSTFKGDITIAKTDPTITLYDNSGANSDPNGKIIFSEVANTTNFEISYNGLNDRLEFNGVISNVLTDLVYINRNTTTALTVLGGATFSGLISANNNLRVDENTYLNTTSYQGGEGNVLDNSGFNTSGIGTHFRWVNSNEGTGDDWKKVADVVITNAITPNGVQLEAKVYKPNTNNGQTASLHTLYYSISFRGRIDDSSTYNDAIVYGPDADMLRVYKTANYTFELQAKTNDDNRDLVVEVNITSKRGGKVTPTTTLVDGTTTGGTAYTATTNNTNKTKFAGDVSFTGATFDDAEVEDLRVNEYLYFGSGATAGYGPHIIHTDSGGTGEGMRITVESDLQVWGVTGNGGEQNQGLYVAGGVAKLYDLNGVVLETVLGGVKLPDDIKLKLGTGSDLQIYHNSTTGNNNIDNETGDLYVTQNTNDGSIIFRSDNGIGGVTEYFKIDGNINRNVITVTTQIGDNTAFIFGSGAGRPSIKYDSTASQLFISGESKFLSELTANNNFVANGTVDLNVMPSHQSEGSIQIGRYDGNATRYHLIKNYVSSTEASNYIKFSLHNGTESTTTDVLSLFGDGHVQVSASGTPQLILDDTGNAGGGGASGKIIYKNTDGNAIGLGYTGDDTTSSDFIISSDAGSTFGGYLGLDASAIDDPSQIILDPKTDVYSTKPVTTANVFVTNDVDVTNGTPSTDQLRASGYGIIGNRGIFYVTNAGGGVQIGNGTVHNGDQTALFETSLITLSKQTLISAQTTIGFGQITTNIGTTSHLKIQPTATTNTTGKTSMFLGTSTVSNYGISLRGARFGDTGTPKFEIAVHNNSSNGSVALEIDQFTNTHIKGELFIEDVDNATAADTDKVLVMSNESGEVQYRTPSQFADDMNVPTGYGGAGLIPIYETADTFTTNSNLYWDIANGRLGLGDTTPDCKLKVQTANVTTDTHSVHIQHNRNNPDIAHNALFIDANYTGTKTAATDIAQTGLKVDLDSSANGTAADEHRIYGIQSDTRNSGFADIVYGIYSYAESNYTAAKTANLAGVYGIATHDSSSTNGGVVNMFGVKGVTQIQDRGDVDNSYGGQFQTLISNNRLENVGVTVGVEAEIQIDEQSALTYGEMHGFRSIIDNNEGAVPTFGNQYLFKGVYQGTRGGAAYGVYCEGDKHYLENKLSVGTTASGFSLNVYSLTTNVVSQFESGDNQAWISVKDDGYTTYGAMLGCDHDDGHAIILADNAATKRLVINNSGQVGIGAENPNAKMHLKNGESGCVNPWSNADEFVIENSGNVGLAFQSPNDGAATIAFQDPESVQAGFIQYLHADNAMRFATNGNNIRLNIDSSGNQTLNLSSTTTQFLGNTSGTFTIKNTTGGINIMANGSSVVSAYITSSLITLNEITQVNNTLQTVTAMRDVATWDSAVIRVSATNTIDTTGFLGMRFATSTTNNYGWRVGANRSGSGRGSLRFFEHNNSVAGVERFTLKQDGNVGISVDNPDYLLDVNNKAAFGGTGSYRVFVSGTAAGSYIEFGLNSNNGSLGTMGTYASAFNFETSQTNGFSWKQSGSEKMNLAADGDLKIARYLEHLGDTNSYLGWAAGDDFRIVTGGRELLKLDEGTNPDILNFMSSTITMSSEGNFTAAQVTASGDVIAFSDKRVKTNIKTINNGLEKVTKLRGVSYNRTDVDDKSNKIGVIAQEVQEVLPEVVNYDNKKDLLGVDYGKMAGVFIEAIKELKAEVDSLKDEIKQLKK